MAKLVYDKSGRLLFTKEMKKEYTILMPMMLPTHFTLIKMILEHHGYKMELLDTTHPQIVNEGLQSVHNDTCYPALLVIGQLIDAVKSGKYDKEKIALIITQTGGGCRASNYIHLLRKARDKNGLDNIPVVSFNLAGMEKNPGFKLTIPIIAKLVAAVIYADMLMLLSNQTKPYEKNKGESDTLVKRWLNRLIGELNLLNLISKNKIKSNLTEMASDFAGIPLNNIKKIRVGIVGEIYMKYAPLGNNNLEQFLDSEGAEVVVPGLLDFVIFIADHAIADVKLYGIKRIKGMLSGIMKSFLLKRQKLLIEAVKTQPKFVPPSSFEHLKSLINGYVHEGNKMGEGWLLTAEMLELINSGVNNIVCTQPFGCLPNHIVGKGMLRRIKDDYPESNIVAIDYDPGATKINQENRIKLMLSNARLSETTGNKPQVLKYRINNNKRENVKKTAL